MGYQGPFHPEARTQAAVSVAQKAGVVKPVEKMFYGDKHERLVVCNIDIVLMSLDNLLLEYELKSANEYQAV